MKKTILCVSTFLFLTQSVFAQTGFIEYDIEVKGITPELNKGALLLADSRMRIAYQDSNLRQDYKMGEMSINSTILNRTNNQAIFYENGPNGKYAVYGTCLEIEQLATPKVSTTIRFEDETKEILGITCKKAIVSYGGLKEEATYWYTDNYPYRLPKKALFFDELPGVPLEFTMTSNGYFMRFRCSNYTDEIEGEDVYFTAGVTPDFQVMDFQAYLKLLKEAMTQSEATPKNTVDTAPLEEKK